MLYFQSPIIKTLEKKKITDNDIQNLAIIYLKLCKEIREKTPENKSGVFIINNIDQIKLEIISQQKNLPQEVCNKKPTTTLSIKPSLFASFMSKTGILGYYNPFTAEGQYNPNVPATQLPFTLAHEMSHQLGYAREQEASFIAYLAARNSDNIALQYSSRLYVLKSLLRAVSKTDPEFTKKILNQYSNKMKRDRENELKFIQKNDGFISELFGVSNDLFLKSNQQDGSISYSYFVNLLVIYELK